MSIAKLERADRRGARAPYERPLLSKDYVHDEGFYADKASRSKDATCVPVNTGVGTASRVVVIGGVQRDLHAEHGVDLHLSTQVEAIVGTVAAQGIRTKDGSLIEDDLVVVGVGAPQREELARDAGLHVGNGIVVAEFLHTSAAQVFAAGDVASTWNPMYQRRIRMEHSANALNQGQTAARNMLGQHTAYEIALQASSVAPVQNENSLIRLSRSPHTALRQ